MPPSLSAAPGGEAHESGGQAPSRELTAQIDRWKEDLAAVATACDAARQAGQTGRLFFLLRKKWKLTQRIFEAESALRLLPTASCS